MGAALDNFTAKVAAWAVDALDFLEQEELEAGGIVSDLEVRAAHAFIRPRLARMIKATVAKGMDEYGSRSMGSIMEEIGGLFAEHRAENPG